jgi:hypothetical protein
MAASPVSITVYSSWNVKEGIILQLRNEGSVMQLRQKIRNKDLNPT